MIDCLFVLRDLGETHALVPVVEQLVDQGRDIKVLALGQAVRGGLVNENGRQLAYILPDDVDGVQTQIGTKPGDFGGSSGLHVPFADAMDAPLLAERLHSHVIVSGVVARSQRDFLAAAKAHAANKRASMPGQETAQTADGARGDHSPSRIGFYGSLAVNINCALLQPGPIAPVQNQGPSPSFVPLLDALWVPMQALIEPIVARTFFPRSVVTAVGHPEAETFFNSLPMLEKRAEDVRRRLQVAPGETLVFFASGRDEPGKTLFQSSFRAFLRGLKEASANNRDIRAVVGIHPACSGTHEDALIAEFELSQLARTVRTVRRPAGDAQFSTDELLVAADKVLSWNSTAASQLALRPQSGAQVMFVSGEGQPEIFAAVQAGLAAQATSSREVAHFLLTPAQPTTNVEPPRPLMPLNSVALMAGRIDEAISAAQRQASVYLYPAQRRALR